MRKASRLICQNLGWQILPPCPSDSTKPEMRYTKVNLELRSQSFQTLPNTETLKLSFHCSSTGTETRSLSAFSFTLKLPHTTIAQRELPAEVASPPHAAPPSPVPRPPPPIAAPYPVPRLPPPDVRRGDPGAKAAAAIRRAVPGAEATAARCAPRRRPRC